MDSQRARGDGIVLKRGFEESGGRLNRGTSKCTTVSL